MSRVVGVRRPFVWASLLLVVAVLIGLALQLYFIAAWIFGSEGALDAHKTTGSFVVSPLELFAFVAALIGWWRNWRNVLWSLALPIVGTVQLLFVGDIQNPKNGWVHGLHGGLVLVVAAIAGMIARREADALGLRAGSTQEPSPPERAAA